MYLFKYNPGRDKSSFLRKLGYSEWDSEYLKQYFYRNTDVKQIKYSRMSKTNDLMGISQLYLPGKYCNGAVICLAWKINIDLTIEFETMIIDWRAYDKSGF